MQNGQEIQNSLANNNSMFAALLEKVDGMAAVPELLQASRLSQVGTCGRSVLACTVQASLYGTFEADLNQVLAQMCCGSVHKRCTL